MRAVKAMEFGLSIRNHGYNIFVSGIPGTGRNSIARSIVKRISLERPVLMTGAMSTTSRTPTGRGRSNCRPEWAREFRRDVEKFIEFMQSEIPRSSSPRNTKNRSRASRTSRRRQRRYFLPMPAKARSHSGFS